MGTAVEPRAQGCVSDPATTASPSAGRAAKGACIWHRRINGNTSCGIGPDAYSGRPASAP